MVNFLRGLPDEEEAAGDQDQVAPRESVAEQFEHGLGELHDNGNGGEQRQSQDQGRADADAPCPRLLLLWQLVRQDGDEDQIVDAENDLQHHQGHKRDPGFRIGDKLKVTGKPFHCSTPRWQLFKI